MPKKKKAAELKVSEQGSEGRGFDARAVFKPVQFSCAEAVPARSILRQLLTIIGDENSSVRWHQHHLLLLAHQIHQGSDC